MTNKLFSLVASVALIALTSTAYASQPGLAPPKQTLAMSDHQKSAPAKQRMQLSANQMDRVTAGGVGSPNASTLALTSALAVSVSSPIAGIRTTEDMEGCIVGRGI